jgi:hypothetical protein
MAFIVFGPFIDEPLPGVMRVTEIEEISVAVPDEGAEDENKE